MSLFTPATSSDACFALLDDIDASAADARSRLYRGYLGALSCQHAADLPALLQEMQQALQEGKFAVGLYAYELGAELHGIAAHAVSQPLAEILLFEHCEHLSAAQVDAWLAAQPASPTAGIAQVSADTDVTAFCAAIERIHDYIAAGDTYQVNYTYRLRFDAYGSVHALYRRLRARQAVPYGALIALPDGRAVLSLSPELFVRHEAGVLTVRPMKGTAAASGNVQQDQRAADALAHDAKNRAENLMIVDLLRNDLGRLAKTGSVQVDKLFDVQRYSSVLQMTSTIHAQLRETAGLPEIFEALYPCGSITGAPKHRTMQIIRELEVNPRGLYTGAIAYFDPPSDGQRLGDFCMSVPIRTLQLQALDAQGLRKGEMGVGAGIVHDSVALDEYEECRLKAGFLIGMQAEFELFETIHASRVHGCRHLERHLQRLARSAAYFDFAFDAVAIRAALHAACAALATDADHRLRFALKQDGSHAIQTAVLTPLTEPVRLLLAKQATDADDLFLRHKTTIRTQYDAAWRAAEQQGAFDQLFCNAQGEITEGGRSTLFVKLQGQWYTPPLSSGVLPGVMRGVVLDDPVWTAQERILTLQDCRNAEQIFVCNALRGVVSATIVWDA
ncbi:Aminodeoxychorismate synthase component 1 [compost metagenome]